MIPQRLALALLALWLAACSPQAAPADPATLAPAPTATLTPAPTPRQTLAPPGPVTLRIWLPPEFDPASETPGGQALQRRLEAFVTRRTDARLEVRIKTLDGPGGVLESLSSASAAAPLAMPDLVALPRPLLEAAALKGLLHPFDGLLSAPDDPDWFDYARQLSRLQDSTFGLPFAGDILLLVYRPQAVPTPPAALASAQSLAQPLAFPAADPQSIFTLALYQAAGGMILDPEGRPGLALDPLTRVLEFYHSGAESGLTPFWLTQFETHDQAWQAFDNQRASMLVSWASAYLQAQPPDSAVAPLPTLDGEPFSLAAGWVWALASPNPEHQRLAVQLAEFLTEPGFLAEWTAAAGYLPPRPSALEDWGSQRLRSAASQASSSARILPSTDVLASLAPPLRTAALDVLKNQSTPADAASHALQAVSAP